MASKTYTKSALTGGVAGCLDAIDGADLSDGDKAIVMTATGMYHYKLNATSAESESSPSVISPDSNAGDKRWILVSDDNIYSHFYPDSSESDQGVTAIGNGDTIYDIITSLGTSKYGTIVLRHTAEGNTTSYNLDTNIDLSSYDKLQIKVEPGAILTRTSGTEVLTLYSPSTLLIGDTQKITAVDMLSFTNGGRVHPEWWGATGDGTTDDYTAVQSALDSGGSLIVFQPRTYLVKTGLEITADGCVLYGIGTYRNDAPPTIKGSNFSPAVPIVYLTGGSTGSHTAEGTTLENIRILAGDATPSDVFKAEFTNNLTVRKCMFDASNYVVQCTHLIEVWDSEFYDSYLAFNFLSDATTKDAVLIEYGTDDNSNFLLFNKCVFETIVSGVTATNAVKLVSGATSANKNNAIQFVSCHFEPGDIDTIMIYSNSSYLTNLRDCTFYRHQTGGVTATNPFLYIEYPYTWHIDGCRFEQNFDLSLSYIHVDATAANAQVSIVGCLFASTLTTPTVPMVDDDTYVTDYGRIHMYGCSYNGVARAFDNDTWATANFPCGTLSISGDTYGRLELKENDGTTSMLINRTSAGNSFECYGETYTGEFLSFDDANGKVIAKQILQAVSSAWNGAHLQIGDYHLWVDATGDLRIKQYAPANDTDGTIVGTQS